MLHTLHRWARAAFLTLIGSASATPALPSSAVATDAVRAALSVSAPAQPAEQAAQNRSAAIAAVQAQTVALSPARGRSVVARSTAYNSLPGQTDSNPFITATGTRTRPGVIALSRDLLRVFPYGTRVTLEDLSGRNSALLKNRVFIVEDTMAARKTGSVDIWMPTRSEALNWGARQIRITALR